MKKIEILFLEGGGFDVIFEGKNTELIGYDEMLGVVTQLAMPDKRICLNWLKSEEQREAIRKAQRELAKDLEEEFFESKP